MEVPCAMRVPNMATEIKKVSYYKIRVTRINKATDKPKPWSLCHLSASAQISYFNVSRQVYRERERDENHEIAYFFHLRFFHLTSRVSIYLSPQKTRAPAARTWTPPAMMMMTCWEDPYRVTWGGCTVRIEYKVLGFMVKSVIQSFFWLSLLL